MGVSDSTLHEIVRTVNTISNFIMPYAIAASGVGALSMALIQTAKDIFPVREWFQRRKLRSWYIGKENDIAMVSTALRDSSIFSGTQEQGASESTIASFASTLDTLKSVGNVDNKFKSFQEEVLSLATDGDESAFYNLPIEQLCGQLNASAQIAIEYPTKYIQLLLPLAEGADHKDIVTVVTFSGANAEVASDKTLQSSYTDSRNRMAHQMQRAIDAVQISFGASWKKWLQIGSIGLSAIICFAAVGIGETNIDLGTRLLLALVSSIIGGFLAPVARDLVAALQKLRS
jgi:hypothetical protein